MKLRNSTDWPDYFLRRMVAWCCRQVDYKPSRVREAQFRNRTKRSYSGHAYGSRRIVASVGPDSRFPLKADDRPGMGNAAIADRLEALIVITAHELTHLHQYDGRIGKLKSNGQTEADARWHSIKALESFRVNREALLAEWSLPLAERPAKPSTSVQEKRAAKAQADLDRWQRKLKLAQTKIRKLKQRVRYYDRVAASRSK
jgi:hypothetical protein